MTNLEYSKSHVEDYMKRDLVVPDKEMSRISGHSLWEHDTDNLKTQNIQEVVSLRCAEARLIKHHSHGLYVQPRHMCLPGVHKSLDLQCVEINEDRRSHRYRFTLTLNYCAGTSGHLQDPERLQQKCSPIPTPIPKIRWSLT